MKNTNPIFSLKNFRSFGEEGADFELAPITVLTGCNSAGKSSLVKALLLLSKQPIDEGSGNQTFTYDLDDSQDTNRQFAGTDIKSHMPGKQLKVSLQELGLGRFDKVVHHHSVNELIVLSYKIWSYYLQENVLVKRSFKAGKDLLNEGELIEFLIERMDGTILFKYHWNSGKNIIFDPELGEICYPIGWEGTGHISSIIEKCDRYIDFCKLKRYQRNHKFASKWLSKYGSANGRNESGKKYAENMLSVADNGMREITSKWGEQLETYKIPIDWDVSLSLQGILLSDNQEKERLLNDDLLSREDVKMRQQNNVFHSFVNECLLPWFIKNVVYIDSSSANVKRLYSIEDENKMCIALSKLVKNGITGSYVNKWLKKFNIADSIEIVGTEEGIGIMVYLNKGGEKYLLADEGYGITQLVSLFLQLENIIIENRHSINGDIWEDNTDNNFYYSHSFVAIEEPEIHLHPKYQSLLADMFVEAYQKYNIHFIIETHSEYLIRKLQVLVADKENILTPNDVSLNYVEKNEDGISTNRKIEIREDGSLNGTLFGSGFYDEADSLAMELFRRKPILS